MEERLSWKKTTSFYFSWFCTNPEILWSEGKIKSLVHPIIRQLEFHGVLILAGKHIAPHLWPGRNSLSQYSSLAKICKLFVVEDLQVGSFFVAVNVAK